MPYTHKESTTHRCTMYKMHECMTIANNRFRWSSISFSASIYLCICIKWVFALCNAHQGANCHWKFYAFPSFLGNIPNQHVENNENWPEKNLFLPLKTCEFSWKNELKIGGTWFFWLFSRAMYLIVFLAVLKKLHLKFCQKTNSNVNFQWSTRFSVIFQYISSHIRWKERWK